MLLGLIVAGVAGGISIASYANASEVGGSYVVLWGAVVTGGLMFIKGLFDFLQGGK